MAYPPPQPAFYHPAHSAVLDPRLRNWSSWAQDPTAPVDPNVDPVAHILQTPATQARPADLFPDEDPQPSFAPPAHPTFHADTPDMLWSSPGSRPASRNNELFHQPVQQWPADIANGYANILADPTTLTLPYGHRQQTAYTPAHKMSKGVHIDSSFDHGHGHGNHQHPSPPPLALMGQPGPPGPPGLLTPPGWDLVAGMESLALVPVVPPPAPRRPVELYHNNINSVPRPPSAPPALTEAHPPVDADYGPIAPSPGPPRQSAPPMPMHHPPPAQHYDFSQYMPPAAAAPPAPAPPPATTVPRSYGAGFGGGNHINASAATRTPSPLPPPAPARGVTPKMVHEMDDSFYRQQYTNNYHSDSNSSGQSSLGKSDKPLKGILQRTQYEDPPAPPGAWAGLWNEPAAYNPVVPTPLSQHTKQPRYMSEARKRGNSVSAFETPVSYQAGLHGYSAAAMGAAPTRKHAQSQSVSHGHHVISPQDRLNAMLSDGFPSTQGHNAPTGTHPHPFFHEFTATPQQPKSAGPMGSGGYPWYPQGSMDTPSTQLGETYVSGLYADEMPPSGKTFKGGNKDQQRAEKENHLLRSNSITYGALPKTTAAPPEHPVKDKSRRVSTTSPFPDASMFGGAAHKAADHSAPTAPQSWYTSSSAPAPTPAPTAVGGKIKKSKNKVQIQQPVTPAAPVITPILQKPNEAAQFYGQAVKFADDPIIKKKSKR